MNATSLTISDLLIVRIVILPMFLFRSSPRANPGLILKGIIEDVNRKLSLKSKFKIGFLADSIKPVSFELVQFRHCCFLVAFSISWHAKP
ncbi:hypothetical protein SAMN05216428_11253 [Nitrosospira sp. Nsp11]|nr:hypothetical protein SAMN05216428_11253 [Nitrosospira sp. Nsp11]